MRLPASVTDHVVAEVGFDSMTDLLSVSVQPPAIAFPVEHVAVATAPEVAVVPVTWVIVLAPERPVGPVGHANPDVTLSTYAHLFQQADHAVRARHALEASYEGVAGMSATVTGARSW